MCWCSSVLFRRSSCRKLLPLQRQAGKKVGRLLIEAGIITEVLLANGLARQLRIPFVNLKTFPFRADVVRLLPESAVRRFRALALDDKGDTLLVTLGGPLDLFAFDELTRLLKRTIAIAAVPESQLALAFDRLYRHTEEISGLARALEKDLGDAVDFAELTAIVGIEGAPVVRLLQSLFEDAMQVVLPPPVCGIDGADLVCKNVQIPSFSALCVNAVSPFLHA